MLLLLKNSFFSSNYSQIFAMKIIKKSILFWFILFLATNQAHAFYEDPAPAPPSDDDPFDGAFIPQPAPEFDQKPTVPIDSGVAFLGATGVLYMFYKLRSVSKRSS